MQGFMGRWLALSITVAVAAPSVSLGADGFDGTSLRLAERDCDLYVAALHLNEQWRALQKSPLYTEMMQTDFGRRAMEKFHREWDARRGPIGQLRAGLTNPNIKSWMALLQDMVSEELFLYADGQTSSAVEGINELAQDLTDAILEDPQTGGDQFLAELSRDRFDDIPVPLVALGFKIRDTEGLLSRLDEIEGLVRFGLGQSDEFSELAEGLERVEDSRGTRLAWTLESDMFPWELLPQGQMDQRQEQLLEKVRSLLAGRQICLTFGQLDDFLVLAISEDSIDLLRLGSSDSLLDNPHLAPVVRHGPDGLASVSYMSDDYADANYRTQFEGFFSRNFGNQLAVVEANGGELPEYMEPAFDDLEWLDAQIAKHVPPFKGQMAYASLTDSGSRSWMFDRTEHVMLDTKQGLPVLEHLGSKPMGFLAMRLAYHPEYFATLREIASKLRTYLEGMARDEESPAEGLQPAAEKILTAWPKLEAAADLWEKNFLPAMKDGQHAWVLQSGNLVSRQFHPQMPIATQELTIPEMALITGVNDRDLFKAGVKEALKLAEEAVDQAREEGDADIPEDFRLPHPSRRSGGPGETFQIDLPSEASLTLNVAVQATFEGSFLYAGYSPALKDSLIPAKPLAVMDDFFRTPQTLASAAYLDFERIVLSGVPWLQYAFEQEDPSLDKVMAPENEVLPSMTVKDAIDLARAFSKIGQLASKSYGGEDGGLVTEVMWKSK